jgi:hypothetical protein
MTEVWFRNPYNYVRELAEEGVGQVAWDRGLLVKRKIDPARHAGLYFGRQVPYRLLLVGEQGTAELRPEVGLDAPHAVYPTWSYLEQTAILEELVSNPVGGDPSACQPGVYASDETPVLGQEHRVVVVDTPPANTGPGRKFLAYLRELQEDYTECIIHLHGSYSWRVAFGTGLASADVDPRIDAQKGKVVLPSGKIVLWERAAGNPKWVTVLGFRPADLGVPRNRCLYNIRSARWAGQNYDKVFAIPGARARDTSPVDSETPDVGSPVGKRAFMRAPRAEGDKFLCNSCSIQSDCSYFREGAVCTVPDSEPLPLARYFKTRDSNLIIEGLGTLLAVQTRRLDEGLRAEMSGGIDPDVTKLINNLFDRGVALAKLVDPGLRNPKLAVNISGNSALVVGASPAQMVAAVCTALEARGIARRDITPAMVENLLESLRLHDGDVHQAIEGTVVASRDERTA